MGTECSDKYKGNTLYRCALGSFYGEFAIKVPKGSNPLFVDIMDMEEKILPKYDKYKLPFFVAKGWDDLYEEPEFYETLVYRDDEGDFFKDDNLALCLYVELFNKPIIEYEERFFSVRKELIFYEFGSEKYEEEIGYNVEMDVFTYIGSAYDNESDCYYHVYEIDYVRLPGCENIDFDIHSFKYIGKEDWKKDREEG